MNQTSNVFFPYLQINLPHHPMMKILSSKLFKLAQPLILPISVQLKASTILVNNLIIYSKTPLKNMHLDHYQLRLIKYFHLYLKKPLMTLPNWSNFMLLKQNSALNHQNWLNNGEKRMKIILQRRGGFVIFVVKRYHASKVCKNI